MSKAASRPSTPRRKASKSKPIFCSVMLCVPPWSCRPTHLVRGRLPGRSAAVHDYSLACDVGGCGGGEEDDYAFEVLGVTEASQGDVFEHPLLELLDQAAAHAGGEPARSYGVDGDVVLRP